MRVMIALDGSECSKYALEHVVKRPWRVDDLFLIAHVVEPIPVDIGIAYVPNAYSQTDGAAADAAYALMEVVKKELHEALPSHSVETKVAFGMVKSEILDLAKSWKADLIVMGSHGRTGFNRLLLGSVAEEVLRGAHCSVEIVKQHK